MISDDQAGDVNGQIAIAFQEIGDGECKEYEYQ